MENISITKQQAISAYSGNSAALARALKISPAAVYQWAEGPIHDVHALKLRFVLKPDIFSQPNASIPAPSAQPSQTVGACGE